MMAIEIGVHQITCNPEHNFLTILCNTKYIVQVHFKHYRVSVVFVQCACKICHNQTRKQSLDIYNVFHVEKLRLI